MDFNRWNIIWSLCFALLAMLIIVGNILTIWIFIKQKRRKRAQFLLISLAVADLLVGLLTVPLYIAVNTALRKFGLAIRFFIYIDMCTGLTSMFTLAVISLERMYAIGWPLRHRTLSLRAYKFAIVTPWIIAAIVVSIKALQVFTIIKLKSFAVVLVLTVITPLLVMSIAYFVIWRKQRSRMGDRRHIAREKKLTKTLFMITAASLLTWLPFYILTVVIPFTTPLQPLSSSGFWTIKLLQFSNSLVNVIIYPFRIREFKGALLKMLHYRGLGMNPVPRAAERNLGNRADDAV